MLLLVCLFFKRKLLSFYLQAGEYEAFGTTKDYIYYYCVYRIHPKFVFACFGKQSQPHLLKKTVFTDHVLAIVVISNEIGRVYLSQPPQVQIQIQEQIQIQTLTVVMHYISNINTYSRTHTNAQTLFWKSSLEWLTPSHQSTLTSGKRRV